MMDIVKIVGIALTGCIMTVLVKKYLPDLSVLISILTGVVVLLITLEAVRPILSVVTELFSAAGLRADYGKIVVRALGICLIAGFAADSCRDAGESALANRVELACKVIVTSLSLPFFQELIGMAKELIKG